MATQTVPPVETAPILELRRVEVTYNRVETAIQGVSIAVPPGQIACLLGPNGAGKTTTLRAISGFLPGDNGKITHGQVVFEGQLLNGKSPHSIAQLGISLIPERDKVFRTLTVEENLRAIPPRGSEADRQRTRALIDELFPILAARRRQTAGYLSGGERQMLAIAKSLILQPRVLLADELSFGIAPTLVGRLMQALRTINQVQNTTIVLVEQNAAAGLQIADYVYILETGRTVLSGPPSLVAANEEVQKFYLGLGADATEESYSDARQHRRKRRWWG